MTQTSSAASAKPKANERASASSVTLPTIGRIVLYHHELKGFAPEVWPAIVQKVNEDDETVSLFVFGQHQGHTLVTCPIVDAENEDKLEEFCTWPAKA